MKVKNCQRNTEKDYGGKRKTGQFTVEEFLNKMDYVGWKGVKEKQGSNDQVDSDLPEADIADGDLDVDLKDINVNLLNVSLQDINTEHLLQDILADGPPKDNANLHSAKEKVCRNNRFFYNQDNVITAKWINIGEIHSLQGKVCVLSTTFGN